MGKARIEPVENANHIQGIPVSDAPLTNGQVFVYNSATGKFEPGDAGGQKALAFGGTDEFTNLDTGLLVVYRVIFPGTALLGTPSSIKLMLYKEGNGTQLMGRIYDYTNGNDIVAYKTLVPTGSHSPSIVDVGTLQNLPSGEAIFEIAIMRSGGGSGNNMHCYGGVIYW